MQIRSVVVVVALGLASFAHGQQAVQWRVEDGGNGHWYARNNNLLTWEQAVDAANNRGGYLASTTTAGELAFIRVALLLDGMTCWLGGTIDCSGASGPCCDDCNWRWTSGEPFDVSWSGWVGENDYTTERLVTNGIGFDDMCSPCVVQDYRPPSIIEWSADCNGDGIVDYGQILAGDLDDADENGIPDACEIPAGEFLITDSADDFSSVQGANGWRYEFDRGISTVVQPMPHFVTPAFSGGSAWSTRPTFGWPSGSYCAIGATECATSTPYSCSSYYAGLERSRRRWTGEAPVHGSLALFGRFFNHAGTVARLDVLLDGVLAYSISASTSDTLSDPTVIGVILPLEGVTSIELVADPLDGSCHSDTIRCTARIFGADCNGDGIVDYGQILDGTFEDVNSNGVPDTCEIDPCPGDITENGFVDGVDLSLVLSLWGTNGQKFPRSDTNDDGIVDANDLAVVLSGWGKCP